MKRCENETLQGLERIPTFPNLPLFLTPLQHTGDD